uniref:Uncharacterized protein n=1 Tax=Dendroctonus ponderosae TaxID=77166 RepID=A0AAR5PCU0_DENPD
MFGNDKPDSSICLEKMLKGYKRRELLKFFAFYLQFVSVGTALCSDNSANYTEKMSEKLINVRRSRLISFNEEGDIRIELDFNVPFITLPIKKSMDMAKTSMVNLNVGALALTGVILFGSVVALPIILTLLNKKGAIPAKNPFTMLYSKNERQRSETSHLWKYLTEIDNSLLENDIDVTSCSQRITCWTVKKSSQKVAEGKRYSSK